MKTRIFAATLLTVMLQLSAWGQGFNQLQMPDQGQRNQAVVDALYAIAVEHYDMETAPNGNKVDVSINPLRGGVNSLPAKPLGCYLPGHQIEYRSEYKDLDPHTMAEWAYDLHQFVANAGGGWDNFRRYQSQGGNPNGFGSGNVSQDWDRSMISYDKQAQFAEAYWDRHSGDKFRHMASMFRGWFIHDALIDGTLLYMTLEGRAGRGADYGGYKDAAIGSMIDKK